MDGRRSFRLLVRTSQLVSDRRACNGNDLVFPGGLPPADMVSTNDLPASLFRSITFDQDSIHTIRGNPITLTNRKDVIINSGSNVIACDLTFTGTPSTPECCTIRGSGDLTVIGNVGGGSLYLSSFGLRSVIRGQFTGGSLFLAYGTLALYGDNPYAVSADVHGGSSRLLVQGSQPNLNITLLINMEDLSGGSVSGSGLVGDVTGHSTVIPDLTLSAKNVSAGWLDIHLKGTNVGQYGRLIASGDVSFYGGRLFPSAGFNPRAGQVYTIVEKTSPGLVANEFLGPEGTITTLNGRPFRISYVGGDGNDVTLTAQRTEADPTFSDANWSALGSGMNTAVKALAVLGNDLYAGGDFTTAGGSPASRIAKWDGTNWSALGSGMNGAAYPVVTALAVSGSDLYAGGSFTTAGGKVSNRIAKARIASAADSIAASGSSATIQFSGVVGYQYHVQRTSSLAPPIIWTTLTTTPILPASDGSLTFTDTNAPPGTAYYRLVQD